jgi:hypothetical protein
LTCPNRTDVANGKAVEKGTFKDFGNAAYGKSVIGHETSGELFTPTLTNAFRNVVDQCLLMIVFTGDAQQLAEYHRSSAGLKKTLLKSVKMSSFSEQVFAMFAEKQHQLLPILIKGEFYKLVKFADEAEIPEEVSEKLDLLVNYLDLPAE